MGTRKEFIGTYRQVRKEAEGIEKGIESVEVG